MDDKVKSFLDKIAMIESSGGKNVNHKTMEGGIHKGTAAIGRYGLMPNTIKEIVKRERLSGNEDPELEMLEMLEPDELTEYVNTNPEIEDRLAKSLAQRVLGRFPSEEQAAYAWNMGHNLTPEKLQERGYESHPYVQKYQKYANKMDRSPDNESDIRLASKVNAPLPSFANESGEIPQRQNALEAFMELYDRRTNELNDAYQKGMQEDLGLTDEQAKGAFMRIDPMAAMGSIKNVAKRMPVLKAPQVADEATNISRTMQEMPKAPPRTGKGIPAALEQELTPDFDTEILKKGLEKTSRVMDEFQTPVAPPKVTKLPESTYSKLPPVAEEESILKRLVDSLNRKPGQ